MANILKEIIEKKEAEVEMLLNKNNLIQVASRTSSKSFKKSLLQKGLSVIAEIKRKSPSKGLLSNISSPIDLARQYVQGEASAISVLTDNSYFGGSQKDLVQIAGSFSNNSVTILRKDFIVHPIQVNESILLGADAILLIAAALKSKLEQTIQYTKEKNIDALVEVHNFRELEIALEAGAEIIGVNNRDLRNFQINIDTSLALIKEIPNEIIKVSESGITTPEIAQQLYRTGFDAVLVGEALVRTEDPSLLIKQMRGIK